MSTESKQNGAKINEKSKLEERFGGDKFIQVPARVIILINSGAIKPLDYLIYSLLLNYMNKEKKKAWPSVATIGGIAKRGEKAVSESLSRLIKANLIIRYEEPNWKTSFTVPLLIIYKGKVIDQTSKFIDNIKKNQTEINKIEEIKFQINKIEELKNNQKAPLAPNYPPETGETGENEDIPFWRIPPSKMTGTPFFFESPVLRFWLVFPSLSRGHPFENDMQSIFSYLYSVFRFSI